MRRGATKWIAEPGGNLCFDLREDPGERAGAEACEPGAFQEIDRWAVEMRGLGEALGDAEASI